MVLIPVRPKRASWTGWPLPGRVDQPIARGVGDPLKDVDLQAGALERDPGRKLDVELEGVADRRSGEDVRGLGCRLGNVHVLPRTENVVQRALGPLGEILDRLDRLLGSGLRHPDDAPEPELRVHRERPARHDPAWVVRKVAVGEIVTDGIGQVQGRRGLVLVDPVPDVLEKSGIGGLRRLRLSDQGFQVADEVT